VTEQGIYLFHKISFLSNDFNVFITKSLPLFPPQSRDLPLGKAKNFKF